MNFDPTMTTYTMSTGVGDEIPASSTQNPEEW